VHGKVRGVNVKDRKVKSICINRRGPEERRKETVIPPIERKKVDRERHIEGHTELLFRTGGRGP